MSVFGFVFRLFNRLTSDVDVTFRYFRDEYKTNIHYNITMVNLSNTIFMQTLTQIFFGEIYL